MKKIRRKEKEISVESLFRSHALFFEAKLLAASRSSQKAAQNGILAS